MLEGVSDSRLIPHLPLYRVWDGQQMHKVGSLDWNIGGLHWRGEGVSSSTFRGHQGWVHLDMAYWLHAENGRQRAKPPLDHLMEYTGVDDFNGTPIFEDDVVHVNGRNRLIERRGGHWSCSWSDYHLGTCWFAGGGPRVVGNRWEQPELLRNALSPA